MPAWQAGMRFPVAHAPSEGCAGNARRACASLRMRLTPGPATDVVKRHDSGPHAGPPLHRLARKPVPDGAGWRRMAPAQSRSPADTRPESASFGETATRPLFLLGDAI